MKAVNRSVKSSEMSQGSLIKFTFAIILIVGCIYRFLGVAPHHNVEHDRFLRIKEVANIRSLPPGYTVSNVSSDRAIWIDHKGHSHVMITVIESSDSSATDLRNYYTIHGDECNSPKTETAHTNGHVIDVRTTSCSSDGADMIDQQAVFPLSKDFAVSVYENAPATNYDYEAFKTVLAVVAEKYQGGVHTIE